MLVEIIAAQLNQQLETFRAELNTEWGDRFSAIEKKMSETCRKDGSSLVGVERTVFLGKPAASLVLK